LKENKSSSRQWVPIKPTENLVHIPLFGSVERSEADKRSDIDVLIVFDTRGDLNKLKEKRQVSETAPDIKKEYDRSLSSVLLKLLASYLSGKWNTYLMRRLKISSRLFPLIKPS